MERGGRGKNVEDSSSLTPYRAEVSQWGLGDEVMMVILKEGWSVYDFNTVLQWNLDDIFFNVK